MVATTKTPKLQLDVVAAGYTGQAVKVATAQYAFDALNNLSVKDRDLATPPGSPADGDMYLIAASPTGAWVGFAASIAYWINGAWSIFTPKEGWRCWIEDEDIEIRHTGSAWVVGETFKGDTTLLDFLELSVETAITASTTQTQGQRPLTKTANHITVCANVNDTVTAPAAVAGRLFIVRNDGAQTAKLFPASGDNFDASAVDASITVLAAQAKRFVAVDATKWITC